MVHALDVFAKIVVMNAITRKNLGKRGRWIAEEREHQVFVAVELRAQLARLNDGLLEHAFVAGAPLAGKRGTPRTPGRWQLGSKVPFQDLARDTTVKDEELGRDIQSFAKHGQDNVGWSNLGVTTLVRQIMRDCKDGVCASREERAKGH